MNRKHPAVDDVLNALGLHHPRSYKCAPEPDRWYADCPDCETEFALLITETRFGDAELLCRSGRGCTPASILRALDPWTVAERRRLLIEQLRAAA